MKTWARQLGIALAYRAWIGLRIAGEFLLLFLLAAAHDNIFCPFKFRAKRRVDQ